jgi:hypothetical protein
MEQVDHLVYATPSLDDTIVDVERRLGVRASPGGQHLGRGTRNALIALGPRCYLEIIGPDPDQLPPEQPRWFGIDDLTSARLVTWAAAKSDLETVVADAARQGIQLGPARSMSRVRPDGVELRWRLTDGRAMLADGLAPFFIDWGASPHPASTAVVGPRLVALHGEHPDPPRVHEILQVLDVVIPVGLGERPSLVAELQSPLGRIELR